MSYDVCQFCGDMAFKTNGKSESICLSRAETGQCKKDKKPAQSEKIPRNQPCPCDSGKKYKHCCDKIKEQGSGIHAGNNRDQKLII